MGRTPTISIIIPSHNRARKLIRLLNSIEKSLFPLNYIEVIVVGDYSRDTISLIKQKYPWIAMLNTRHELLPSAARQLGAEIASGEFLFFIDDDNILHPKTIPVLLQAARLYPQLGLLGPLMLYYTSPRKVWCAGGIVKKPFYIFAHICQDKNIDECKHLLRKNIILCDYIPNAYMIKRSLLREIGGFDYRNFPIAWEEVDLALRVKKKGYLVGIIPKAIVWHDVPLRYEVHVNTKRAYYRARSRVIFYKKYDKKRILLIPLDIAGFLLNIRYSDISMNNKVDVIRSYIDGIIRGLTWKIKQ